MAITCHIKRYVIEILLLTKLSFLYVKIRPSFIEFIYSIKSNPFNKYYSHIQNSKLLNGKSKPRLHQRRNRHTKQNICSALLGAPNIVLLAIWVLCEANHIPIRIRIRIKRSLVIIYCCRNRIFVHSRIWACNDLRKQIRLVRHRIRILNCSTNFPILLLNKCVLD